MSASDLWFIQLLKYNWKVICLHLYIELMKGCDFLILYYRIKDIALNWLKRLISMCEDAEQLELVCVRSSVWRSNRVDLCRIHSFIWKNLNDQKYILSSLWTWKCINTIWFPSLSLSIVHFYSSQRLLYHLMSWAYHSGKNSSILSK